MSRPRTINRTIEDTCEGIRFVLEYSRRACNVQVIPDDRDMATASVYNILAFWERIAGWADRFRAANPGWTVDGRAGTQDTL